MQDLAIAHRLHCITDGNCIVPVHGRTMKKQFVKTALSIICLFVAITAGSIFYFEGKIMNTGTGTKSGLVLLNEIEQLTTNEEGYNPAHDNMRRLREILQQKTVEGQIQVLHRSAILYICIATACLLFVLLYLYHKIVRPFCKLESYAGQIAKGDLEVSLEYERTNFLGAFTWAFDHMRKEIITARKNEAQAVSENKTIIATLSHDIKTPIASIRAYAEGLEANLDTDYEMRERYLQVIMRKCDEVTKLVNDLVLHSLSELERLEIKSRKVSMRKVIEETVQDLEYPYISVREPLPDAELYIDEKRMAQVILNILENARKYAPESKVEIWALSDETRYELHIRDNGAGICPEDMPFVIRKFYRGKNTGSQPGSGLGLYIVSYIMERMGGGMTLSNHTDGLEVILWFPVNLL